MNEKTDRLVEEAVVNSVLSGTNVLDTAINYRNQRAEKSMGRALATLRKMGTDRSEIFISSKVGAFRQEGRFTFYVFFPWPSDSRVRW